MKYLIIVPEVHHSFIEVEASNPTEAFLKVLNDEGEVKEDRLVFDHVLYPDTIPDQVMWEVLDEAGNPTFIIDREGTHE